MSNGICWKLFYFFQQHIQPFSGCLLLIKIWVHLFKLKSNHFSLQKYKETWSSFTWFFHCRGLSDKMFKKSVQKNSHFLLCHERMCSCFVFPFVPTMTPYHWLNIQMMFATVLITAYLWHHKNCTYFCKTHHLMLSK